MPFNINEFISEINENGVAIPANYDVMVFGPGVDTYGSKERAIPMRCIQTELPGRQIQTTDHSHYGPQRMLPVNTNFTEITLQILLDENHKLREYFEKWMDKVAGNYRTSTVNPNMFDLGFYDDYIGQVVITQYNELGDVVHSTTLIEAYPKSLAEETLAWANGNEFMILPVTFVFRYYRND